MATVSDITTTPLSGLNHIDALLDKGPDWNYLSNSNANILFYTFSTASGNETGKSGQETFSAAQQAQTRGAFAYLQQVTGIEFRETTDGTAAQIHLANMDLEGRNTTGLCSWQAGYRSLPNGTLTEYTANAYVYLDNNEWRGMNQNLAPGTQGHETLLHELGHALGLKHPFREGVADEIVLPGSEDNTSNTLMSYDSHGGWYSTYRPYDIAAFNWLYGGDGLRGALGINSTTGGRYITGSFKDDVLVGTGFNDTLQGNGGNDMIDGGAGSDTVVYSGNRNAYTFGTLADGALTVSGAEGTDTLRNIDWLQFADMTVERANVAADTTPPGAPVLSVTKNNDHFATTGNVLLLTGQAEKNAVVRVYIGDELIATATADADGLWSAQSAALQDRLSYQAYATATDAAGNTSVASSPVLFHVDSTAPVYPTLSGAIAPSSNKPVFNGTGEAGSTIDLWRDGDFVKIGTTTVGADGKWALTTQPLPNGAYVVKVTSTDKAGNASSGESTVSMAINSADFQAGTPGADEIAMIPGSKAVDGGTGIDIAVFAGAVGDYTVAQQTWGFTVTRKSTGEVDALYNVERLQFSDGYKAIDIDGAAGEIFRLYQAAFDRAPDLGGMGYWLGRMENGASLMQLAKEFMEIETPTGSVEFDDLYGADLSNEQFVVELYDNVLNRMPDAPGKAYWIKQIEDHSREQVLMGFSESAENQTNVVQLIAQGIDYTLE